MRRLAIGAGVVIAVAGLVIGGVGTHNLWTFAWILWAPVGAVILARRPGNGIGLTLLFVGMAWGVTSTLFTVIENNLQRSYAPWLELMATVLGVIPWLAVVWLLLVFPSGRLTGSLERIGALGLLASAIMALGAFTLDPSPMDLTGEPSPLAVSRVTGPAGWIVSDQGFYLVLGLVAISVISLVLRWVRGQGAERQQFRWLLLGASFYLLTLTAGQFLPNEEAAILLWILGGGAIPLCIGIAVLKYRLYEIDRIISRTVTYTLVVGLLAGVVAGMAAVVGSRFQTPWVVAATTLAVAAVFNPLRMRVRSWVDRRFNRSHYDAGRVLDGFAGSLRDVVDPAGLIEGWVGVVSETMQPASVGIWVRK